MVVGSELALAFSDGVELYLALDALRRACPCATCQGEPDAMGRVVRPEVRIGSHGFELRRMELVGGYALQLYWGDGHSTGIYSFEYLRRLAAAQSS
ncbi:MAG: gamma-butyrobetaine hydroxylase-like domain-containing protein [Verrucomicrobiales bacterium]